MDKKNLEKLIPKKYFDTHVHSPFLKVQKNNAVKPKMLSDYFFETGLNLMSLKNIYPFKKELHVIAIPIPYGDFSAEKINENILKNESKVKNVQIVLRGDFKERDLPILEKQILSSRKVIGLKLYQKYEIKSTSKFLQKALYKKLLILANKRGLIFFIHTNNLDKKSIEFLCKILKKYSKIKIVLTHGAIKLTGYYSYGFNTEKDFQKSLVTKENIIKNKKSLAVSEEKYKFIAKIPRFYVNTALIVRELDLYPIFKILAPKKRIIYGSDMPFAYANRMRQIRESYKISAPNIKKIYEGKTVKTMDQYHNNLLFFLDRIFNVTKFLYPKKQKQIFKDILFNNIKDLHI